MGVFDVGVGCNQHSSVASNCNRSVCALCKEHLTSRRRCRHEIFVVIRGADVFGR